MRPSKDIPETVHGLIKGVDQLVSLPEVCFMVNDLVNNPNSDITEIGRVISQDPDLTARLLKLVNSSFYGLDIPIDTVTRAVTVVGLRELQHMVCAVTARILARECNILHPERLYVAGLLHDIGRLLIFHKLPEAAKEIIAEERLNPGCDVASIEREILGYDHAQIGMALCQSWGLPNSLSMTIGYHHDPKAAEGFNLDIAVLHVANVMAHALEMGDEEKFQERTNTKAWELLNLSDDAVKRILQEAVMQFLEALELLLPGASQRI